VTYNAGLFVKLPLASCSGFGSEIQSDPVNQIRFCTESVSVHIDRFPSLWRSFRTGEMLGKTAIFGQGQVHFRLGTRLA
jgi:hypothetical protein